DVDNYVGKALTYAEEQALLAACADSRSKALPTFITLLLYTGARFSVVQNLRWCDVDFTKGLIKFGKDKTAAGTNREVPLAQKPLETLKFWATQFPKRKPDHFVFPCQKCLGEGARTKLIEFDPTRHFNEIKEAFKHAKNRASSFLNDE